MTNRLAQTKSLYLQKHAENPIDWWPWCDEALATAQRENKPIFLSIGYSSCHWCTVMEGEAFSDAAIAEYMNANFLPIKVDREERPDLDSIYMQALQMLTGQGGWPLNVFLTPSDQVPFYGGTYFPQEPKYGRPGFLQVLQAIRRFYDNETTKLQSIKDEILKHLNQSAIQSSGDLGSDLLRRGLEYSAGILSAKGMGPSFPMIPYAEAALRGLRFGFVDAKYDGIEVCKQRGLNLALGGICDHVGGGFHRYTVDATWTVPHFEKMLYDNGQIVEYLAHLWSAGIREPASQRAIAGTVQWLKREMTAPEGFFYAAQDADSFVTPDDPEPEEGAFYIWFYGELVNLLTDPELAELTDAFMVTTGGNFEGHIVLQRRHAQEFSSELERVLDKLFAARYGAGAEMMTTVPPARNNQEARTCDWPGRIPPVTDTKMIVAWNSLMISGLAKAAIALNAIDYVELAARSANFILQHQWVNGRFHRLNYENQPAVLAQSEDYALFIKALLDLEQAASLFAGNPSSQDEPSALEPSSFWLEQAIKLQDEFDEWLWSVELGGYYNTDAAADLVIRERSVQDNATPSANGVAIANLVRLAFKTEDLHYLDRAELALQSFAGVMEQAPQSCPSLFVALDWYRNHTLVRTRLDQVMSLMTRYFPTAIYTVEPLPSEVVGLVCEGLSCQEPAHSSEQLHQQVLASQTRSER